MRRRDFMLMTAGVTLAAPLVFAPAARAAVTMLDYTPGLIEERLKAGEVVFVDYHATWCTTCAAQQRVLAALTEANPAYAEKITFINVDWDTWKKDAVTTSRNIPRRSTLLLLKGDQELMRIVAGTKKADIQAMLDMGLSVAAV